MPSAKGVMCKRAGAVLKGRGRAGTGPSFTINDPQALNQKWPDGIIIVLEISLPLHPRANLAGQTSATAAAATALRRPHVDLASTSRRP